MTTIPQMVKEADWLTEARKYIGVTEVPGNDSNPVIVGFWKAARLAGIKNDNVPWCAGFACAMLEAVGIVSPRSDGAKSFMTWGQRLPVPTVGCIVVFNRDGGYHVGFVVGVNGWGDLLVLGGNQKDSVRISAFKRERAAGFIWPPGMPLPALAKLPVLALDAQLSTNEA